MMKVGDLVLPATIEGVGVGIIIKHNSSNSSKGFCWEVYDLKEGFIWYAESWDLEVLSESG